MSFLKVLYFMCLTLCKRVRFINSNATNIISKTTSLLKEKSHKQINKVNPCAAKS